MKIPVFIWESYVFDGSACQVCGIVSSENRIRTVLAGNSTTPAVQGPMCPSHWVDLNGEVIQVEQVDLSPGRTPPSKRDKKRSLRQERKLAEDIGGRTQPGSGNQSYAKGDVRKKGKFRVEAKFTKSKSYNLTREVLSKISGECTGGEKPILHVDFVHPSTLRSENSYVVIPYEDWMELINESSKSE